MVTAKKSPSATSVQDRLLNSIDADISAIQGAMADGLIRREPGMVAIDHFLDARVAVSVLASLPKRKIAA